MRAKTPRFFLEGVRERIRVWLLAARIVIVPTTHERHAFAGEWDEVRAELEAAGHVVTSELPVEQRGGSAHIVYETAIRLSDPAVLERLLQILDGVLRDRWQKRGVSCGVRAERRRADDRGAT